MGATPEQITAMAADDLASFEPSWAAALRVAEAMTRDGGRISASVYQELASHWNAGQIIEIISVIGLFNYFNRFANGLDIPPTK
jgi:alkylhydroperoxidase family enzyme